MAHGALTPIIGLRLLALAAGLRHNAEIGQPGLCFSAYGHKFGINHLGPPDHANRGNRAQVFDQHLVHGELGQPDPLAQPVRQVASSAGVGVASVPEEIDRSIGGEMPPDDPQRLLRLKPEGRDVEGETLSNRSSPKSAFSSATVFSTALPPATCSRFLRAAISIIFFERSIAVIRPLVSRSQTSDTATPCPQPTASTRSAGSSARVSTAHTNRSEGLLAMPYALPFPNKGRTSATLLESAR